MRSQANRLGQMNFVFTKVGSNAGKSGHFSRVLQEDTLIVGNVFRNSFENVHLTRSGSLGTSQGTNALIETQNRSTELTTKSCVSLQY